MAGSGGASSSHALGHVLFDACSIYAIDSSDEGMCEFNEGYLSPSFDAAAGGKKRRWQTLARRLGVPRVVVVAPSLPTLDVELLRSSRPC